MDNMEKELWDAFYGKESKQERCSVLTEAELNRYNKGMLKEDVEVQPDLLDNRSGAKKALDDGEEMKKILNKYNQEYNFLYNNHDKVAGYEEAVRAWDEYINHPDFRELIGKVIKARHDMFTSDREIGALMFALDALGYLDKFDGKESSLEPVVKEFKMNESADRKYCDGKIYGYKDNERADGSFDRTKFLCKNGILYKLNGRSVEGTFDIPDEERLVVIDEK